MWYRHRTMVLVFVVVLAACGASTDAQQPAAAACDARYVATTEAGNHIGQAVTVCGEVSDYYYVQTRPDKPTLLLFDQGVVRRGAGADRVKFPDAFSVVIWRSDSKNFPANFGSLYSGKIVCTTGVVEKYDDRPVIVASTPDQIKVGC